MIKSYYQVGDYYKHMQIGVKDGSIILDPTFFKLSPAKQKKMLKKIRRDQKQYAEELNRSFEIETANKQAAKDWANMLDVSEYTKVVPVAVVPLTNSGWNPPKVDWESWKKGEIKYVSHNYDNKSMLDFMDKALAG